MRPLQWLFLLIGFIASAKSFGGWITEPYIGFGQLSLSLGDEALINGESTSYVLGARSGYLINSSLLIAADYSRAGPYHLQFNHRYYGTSIDSGYFTVFSAGLGLSYRIGSWLIGWGQYPYHTLEELKIDFQMKGSMNRMSLGFVLDAKTTLYFHLESSSLSIDAPSSTAQSILCYNTLYDQCKRTGKTSNLFFAVSALID